MDNNGNYLDWVLSMCCMQYYSKPNILNFILKTLKTELKVWTGKFEFKNSRHSQKSWKASQNHDSYGLYDFLSNTIHFGQSLKHLISKHIRCWDQGICFGGQYRRSGDRSLPVGSRGNVPVRTWGFAPEAGDICANNYCNVLTKYP